MQISLNKPELERFVADQVTRGRFPSAADVIEAALARLMFEDAEEEFDEETLQAIRRAEEQLDRGEGRPFKQVADELRKRHAAG